MTENGVYDLYTVYNNYYTELELCAFMLTLTLCSSCPVINTVGIESKFDHNMFLSIVMNTKSLNYCSCINSIIRITPLS